MDLDNSSERSELSALQHWLDQLGLDGTVALDEKTDITQFTAYADGDSQCYIDLGSAVPKYLALNFGIGGTNATSDTLFFENFDDLTKLVWINDVVEFLSGGDCGKTIIAAMWDV